MDVHLLQLIELEKFQGLLHLPKKEKIFKKKINLFLLTMLGDPGT